MRWRWMLAALTASQQVAVAPMQFEAVEPCLEQVQAGAHETVSDRDHVAAGHLPRRKGRRGPADGRSAERAGALVLALDLPAHMSDLADERHALFVDGVGHAAESLDGTRKIAGHALRTAERVVGHADGLEDDGANAAGDIRRAAATGGGARRNSWCAPGRRCGSSAGPH